MEMQAYLVLSYRLLLNQLRISLSFEESIIFGGILAIRWPLAGS